MTAVQTSYSGTLVAGKAGEIASMSPSKVDTKLAEGSSIGFGLAVCQGSGDRSAVLAHSHSPHGIFLGISVRDVTVQASLNSGVADEYPESSNMGVLTEGDIWVIAGGTVAAGDLAHFDNTSGVISGASGTTIAGSRFMTSGDEGDPVVLRLTYPAVGA